MSSVNIIKYLAAIILSFFLSLPRINAQNYAVGIPVDTTYFSLGLPNIICSPEHTTSITFLPSTITGVNNIIRVTQASPPNTVVEQTNGFVNTGDTFIITQAQNNFVFLSPVGSSLFFQIKAVGTPQIAGEDYGCSLLDENIFYDGCRLTYSALNFIDTCNVDPAPFVEEVDGTGILIYPNPVSDWLNIRDCPDGAIILVKDITGKIIFQQQIHDYVNINFEMFLSGIYFLNIQQEKKIYWKKIIRI